MATAFLFDSSLTLNFQQQAAAAVSGGNRWKRLVSTVLQAAEHLASAGVGDCKADGEYHQFVVLLILRLILGEVIFEL